MKKLFLASYASNVISNIDLLLPKPPADLKLAFIPTARDPYDIDKASPDNEKDKLISMGFKVCVVDLKNKQYNTLKEELMNFELLFFVEFKIHRWNLSRKDKRQARKTK